MINFLGGYVLAATMIFGIAFFTGPNSGFDTMSQCQEALNQDCVFSLKVVWVGE